MGRAEIFPEGTASSQTVSDVKHNQENAQYIRYVKRLGCALAIVAALCVGNTIVLSWHMFRSNDKLIVTEDELQAKKTFQNESNAAVKKLKKDVDSVFLQLEDVKSLQQSAQGTTRNKSETAEMKLEKELNSVRLEFENMKSKHSGQESAFMMIEEEVKASTAFIEIVRLELEDVKSNQAKHENDSESAIMMVQKNVTAMKVVIDSFRLELDTVKLQQAEQDKTTVQLLTGFDDILARVNKTDCKVERLSLLEEVHECNQSGSGYLVSGLYGVPDKHLTASSSYDQYHAPKRSRLNNMSDTTSGAGIGAWSPNIEDANPWIQVELNNVSTLIKVTTQGRKDNEFTQWVKSYKVQYSMDGTDWMTVKTCCGQDQVFTGNTDRNTLVTNVLQHPIRARFVRLLPQTWHHYISMRFDITGCPY